MMTESRGQKAGVRRWEGEKLRRWEGEKVRSNRAEDRRQEKEGGNVRG
jgi:hypothetical protein